jgi:DNA-binding PadR family transcriptional regulator
MSGLEFHVLLALADEARHGWAIAERVAVDTDGALRPRAGSLYRVIARLTAEGWVAEKRAAADDPHPGLPRRYYGLTAAGRTALADESARLRQAATVALKRLGVSRS